MSFLSNKKLGLNDVTQTQVSRSLLIHLLIAQVLVIVPHLLQLPLWLFAVWIAVAFWRWQISYGRWSEPQALQKALLVSASCVGLYFSFGIKPSFDAMMSLLIMGFSLKLFELKTRRDILLLLYLAFFISAGFFIVENSFSAVLYLIIPSVFLLHLLMQLQKAEVNPSLSFKDLKQVLAVLLMAIPLLVVLFVVMPRLGSFWSVPSPQQAKTGLSDELSPGGIGELIESNELAFRVAFETPLPERNQLYWRSMALNFFDGTVWRESNRRKPSTLKPQFLTEQQGGLADQRYEIIMEPTGRQWLVALMTPIVWSDTVQVDSHYSITSGEELSQRISYKVRSNSLVLPVAASEQDYEENLQLPTTGNEQTRLRAREWMLAEGTSEQLIKRLLGYYRENFYYTLTPGALPQKNLIDAFLFSTKQGYCEHFASSFVFFMRAAGVPARVVVGYQGGELHQGANYMSVYQRHAHAWAEVLLNDKGWVLIDPTAAVAPDRILKSPEESLSQTDKARIRQSFYSRLGVLASVGRYWDDINYQWVRFVMNFDGENQEQLLSRWLGEISFSRIAAFLLGAGLISFLGLFLVFGRNSPRKPSAESVIFRKLCKKLALAGFAPAVSESPLAFMARVQQACLAQGDLQLHEHLSLVARYYEEVFYASQLDNLAQLARAVDRLSVRKVKK